MNDKPDNEPRHAGAFVMTKDGVVPYSEFSKDKHVVTIVEINHKRDFIEKAAIAAMQGAVMRGDPFTASECLYAAKQLWEAIQKEEDAK